MTETYLGVIYALALLIVPVSGFATVFAWALVREYRREGELPGLMVVLAVIATLAFVASTWFGFLILGRIAGRAASPELLPITATMFLLLEAIPLIVMGYLVWLRRQP